MNSQWLTVAEHIGYQRKPMLDLNALPVDSSDHERTSAHHEILPVPPPIVVDVEVLDDDDDDVVESSPRAFAEAKSKSRRKRRAVVVDLDTGHNDMLAHNILSSCLTAAHERENVPKPPSPPPPPKEPTFSCPICMSQLTEEMSTRCGHIFCKKCIKTALGVKKVCPTCRKTVTVRGLIRVFLPTTD
ncbi:hypothetical protein ACFE04_002344 [Oxalis oulophora]